MHSTSVSKARKGLGPNNVRVLDRNRINWAAIMSGVGSREELEYFASGLMPAHEFRNSSMAARQLITTYQSTKARQLARSYLNRTAVSF